MLRSRTHRRELSLQRAESEQNVMPADRNVMVVKMYYCDLCLLQRLDILPSISRAFGQNIFSHGCWLPELNALLLSFQ